MVRFVIETMRRSAQREAFDETLMHALRLVSDANKVQPSCSYASTPSAIRLSQSLLASLMYAASRLHFPSPTATLSHSFLHPPTSPPPDLVRFVMKQWDGQLSGRPSTRHSCTPFAWCPMQTRSNPHALMPPPLQRFASVSPFSHLSCTQPVGCTLRHPHSHIRSCTHLPPLHQIAAEMRAEPRFRASVSGVVDPSALFR